MFLCLTAGYLPEKIRLNTQLGPFNIHRVRRLVWIFFFLFISLQQRVAVFAEMFSVHCVLVLMRNLYN